MKRKDIELLHVSYLRGPNVWTYRPVIEAWVDIGALEDFPSNTIPGFAERLAVWLPGLAEHRCGIGAPGGFLLRLQEGTWPAHIMEHVAIELQNLAGIQAGFGKARQTSQPGIYKIAVRARNELVGRAAITAARDLVMAAIEDRPFDVDSTITVLREMVARYHIDPGTAAVVDAASERGIPWIRLNEGNLVQLGYGVHQRRIWTAQTDKSSAIADGIARDKDLAGVLLATCGVPVVKGRIVASSEEAWEEAENIGLPVVVKPNDGDLLRGPSLSLDRREDIETAFHLANAEGTGVIVERLIPGAEHRLLVVGGNLVAATRGEQLWVVGDGSSTVRQLIDRKLSGARRRDPLETVDLKSDGGALFALKRLGMDGSSVPGAGQRILIERSGNTCIDCTDKVHPDVAATAALAARIVGLDIAGIDLVAEDISRPLQEQDGAIVKVSAAPDLLRHLKPVNGLSRPVNRAIVEHLLPPETSANAGRIPVVGVAGSRGTTAIGRLVGWLLHLAGMRVGLACADGFYLGSRRLENGNCATWEAGQRLLINRSVEAAVLENGAEQILREGLAYDRCQVGVVTDTECVATLRAFYVNDDEQVFNVLRTQVDVVLPNGVAVLNAADPRVLAMAALCDGEVILYAATETSDAIGAHRANGGRAVYVRDGELIMALGGNEESLVRLAGLLCLTGTKHTLAIETVLASVGAAWALGLTKSLIIAGISTFSLDEDAVELSPSPNLVRDAQPELRRPANS